MNDTLKSAIEKLQTAKTKLESFSSRKEAIEALIKETKLEREACEMAYDFLLSIDFDIKK